MIRITRRIGIDEKLIRLDFIRASGPGGQNVNKVATAVQLRFDAGRCPSLPDAVRQRLMRLAGKRMTDQGILIIEAKRFRTQERNRQDAMNRLIDLVRRAAEPPKHRRKTKPSLASKQRRLDNKQRRATSKKMRRPVSSAGD